MDAPLPKKTGLPSRPPEGESTEGSLGAEGLKRNILVTLRFNYSNQCNWYLLGVPEVQKDGNLGNVVPKKFSVVFYFLLLC